MLRACAQRVLHPLVICAVSSNLAPDWHVCHVFATCRVHQWLQHITTCISYLSAVSHRKPRSARQHFGSVTSRVKQVHARLGPKPPCTTLACTKPEDVRGVAWYLPDRDLLGRQPLTSMKDEEPLAQACQAFGDRLVSISSSLEVGDKLFQWLPAAVTGKSLRARIHAVCMVDIPVSFLSLPFSFQSKCQLATSSFLLPGNWYFLFAFCEGEDVGGAGRARGLKFSGSLSDPRSEQRTYDSVCVIVSYQALV